MAPRETENNAYAIFWGDKQRALRYVMVFSGVVNWFLTLVPEAAETRMKWDREKSLMNSTGFELTANGFALHTASQGLDMSSKVIDSADICGARK